MADKDVLYHELLEALQADGCAVCRLARRASDRYINALLYEGVIDVDLRQTLRNARGPCRTHAWRMAHRRGSVLGVAIVYRDIINTLTTALEAPEKRGLWNSRADSTTRRLAATAPCPACQLEEEAAQRAIKTLLKHISDPAIGESYRQAGGLCLPHFTEALDRANASASVVLREWQAAAYRRLRDELDELIRKHDHRFRSETITEREAIAWMRAVAGVVGEDEPTGRD